VSFAAGGATPAWAQAQPRWTGFYAGLYAGWAWGGYDATTTVPCTSPNPYLCLNTPNTGSLAVAANGSGSVVSAHFTGGIQAGYNWQIVYFVYGVEADFGAFNLQGSRSVTATYLSTVLVPNAVSRYTIGTSIDTDWLFTLRGRVGWTDSIRLIYVTGGLAVTRLTATNSFSDNFGPATGGGSYSGNRVGWTVGAGLERALDKD
jgi:outer membrane immunogenic protein